MITYRKATADDIRPALDLALRVFMEYEAPDYEPEAAVNFKKDCIKNEAYINRLLSGNNLMFVALDNNKIIGMVAERDNGEILMLFVDGYYHRQGIATALISDMICTLKLQGYERITLDSSPYALPFYLKYGFLQTGDVKNNFGCIVIPMAYQPNEIWDVFDENGIKTGQFHERGRKMATGDYHLVVHVWKHNGRDEWLIDRRSSEKHGWPGIWETTGGSALAGDDSLTAALRKTKEELGIDLDPKKGTLFRRIGRHGNNGHTWFQDAWVFEWNGSIDEIFFQEGETCDAMWASADKIREMMAVGEFIGNDVYPYFDEMVEKWRVTE
ncbi:MAG: GNAT family N-acetyltransferase [Oscillospiraceae bacterium]|nr:GNAT family N-acetyltransferase [Oscillospiraceae bacterium]MDD4414937.1 GNAT family N-acetyltransferase [Oscillospiraceae bacterium]